jgi:thymidylate kinase
MYLTNTDEIADHILNYKLENTFKQIKSGMEQLIKSDESDAVIDAYDDLKKVLNDLKEVLGEEI